MAALVALICLFGNLGAMGLVGPDEPRYAWIARAMAETSDWVTPRLYGQPWFEKPILYYWAAAAGFRLHLPAEWAARLPSALAALAAALAIRWLARKHYGGDAVSFSSPYLLAPLVFSTSVAAIGFSRAATPDMLFGASTTLAMASVAHAFRCAGAFYGADHAYAETRKVDLLPIGLFGAFLGFAVLSKGPVAIILAGGAIGLWALATKRWRVALRAAHPLAIAAFCVVALPWYVLCAIRNPDFLRIFIFQHNFERYLTPMFQHRQPFWFFLPIALLAILPWTVFLWPAFQEALIVWKEKSWARSPGFFFGCWAVFPVVFFSFSQSKLPGYILPAIPPLALLCSVSALRALRHSPTRRRALLVGIGISWLPIGFAAAHSIVRISPGLGVSYFFGGAAAAVGLLLIAASFYRTGRWVIPLCILFMAASIETVNVHLLPVLDRSYSARPHAEFMHNDLRPDRIFTYQLSRSWDYGLAFYFRRQLPEWSPTDPDAALVLTTPAGLREITRLDRFRGVLNDNSEGILYVPVMRIPSLR